MISLSEATVYGFDAAIRGMRNPLNSWDKSDSVDMWYDNYVIGPKDLELAQKLVKAGTDHRKFLRMIQVWVDIKAPLYWWKEFSTYKIGTVANSCSTMHKIADKEFTLDDFSHEHLIDRATQGFSLRDGLTGEYQNIDMSSVDFLMLTCHVLNLYRNRYLETKDKRYWWQMIQLLPSSYNQLRTVNMNYEVLRNMYHSRKNHKLDEWHTFCEWVETLPYAKELICVD